MSPAAVIETEMIEAAKRLGNKNEHEISEEEHFFENLVPKLKQMSPLDRMECQGEIHMIVLKYMKKCLVEPDSATETHPHLPVLTPMAMVHSLMNSIDVVKSF
ncbi:hypothetical protein PoB_001439200 [Plakobranchus ocellatus]|uniref:BESS domain-containing protein n=1 Tax=Plakobranchus ocellatus TaxID=259542 RepID=A0AAV3YY42_9GAST|nr:hypothetical protein PoB_001439200 [Plakobranchus ocellatus]